MRPRDLIGPFVFQFGRSRIQNGGRCALVLAVALSAGLFPEISFNFDGAQPRFLKAFSVSRLKIFLPFTSAPVIIFKLAIVAA